MGQSPAGPAGSGVAMVRRAAVPGAHPPGAPALEVQGASLASQEEVSFLDIATRQHLPSRLLRGFRRGFHIWGNPGFWKTLENSGLLAQLPFLSVHGSISRNIHSFIFHSGLGRLVVGRSKQEAIKCIEGEASLSVHSIFTSTYTSSHLGAW